MFSTLRTRFGIPGVISVIALVFALFGGAYAASNSSNAGKATASAKGKKGPRGPKGATGPAGPAGAQGPAGPAGAKGDAGANGSNGAAGPTGSTGPQGNKGPTGPQGAPGATGATGFSGFTENLPSGKTETGTWSMSQTSTREGYLPTLAISFPIPLKEAGVDKAFAFGKAETAAEEFGSSGCSGTVIDPQAPPGVLCVYTDTEALGGETFSFYPGAELRIPGTGGTHGYGPTGSVLYAWLMEGSAGSPASLEATGTWAVTAPTAP